MREDVTDLRRRRRRAADRRGEDSGQRAPAAGVAPTAAPGVAFNYRYAFRLPAENIGRVQEEHAQACEKLGIERCRITGDELSSMIGDRHVEAQLAFKLDPALARTSAGTASAPSPRPQGELLQAAITGSDVGSEIDVADPRSRPSRRTR